VRVAVYTDYAYRRVDGHIYAERAFALFLARLAREVERLTLVGRLNPAEEASRYRIGEEVEFLALPFYPTLARPLEALVAMRGALLRFWRALEQVDCVWLLGPHPLAIAFVGLAAIRRKRVVLGVRSDFPTYVRARHPGRPAFRVLGWMLDGLYRLLARALPVIVVGPDLAHRYRDARRLLEIAVSLVEEADIVPPHQAARRSYDGELRVLSVGRLETEKNPLLLADTLEQLSIHDARWRLVVCGEGAMKEQLAERFERLGLSPRVRLRGYVPLYRGLTDEYRRSHVFLHVAWTEGLPQVLLEAFAAGVPVVATDVGGIRDAVGDAVLLVPPGDPDAAAAQLRRVAHDPALRRSLVRAGNNYVSSRTLSIETRRVAAFLHDADIS
jgi:glycosyltransferase involved in cell wall biosynthesis